MIRLRGLFPFLVAGAVAAALTLAGTTIAAAGAPAANIGPATARVVPHVTTSSLCQSLWAVVNSDGTLARSGCAGTTSKHVSTGGYQVIFHRNITGCAYLATTGLSGSS